MRSQLVFASLAGIALAVLAGRCADDAGADSAQAAADARVVLVTLDGARTEEIFGGLDVDVLRSTLGPKDRLEDQSVYRRFWADTPQARRARLMPFFWNVLMREHGSIAGNRALGSRVSLANRHRFSYPGYGEMLLGHALDDEITSNDLKPAPRQTVLEYARAELQLRAAQVALFASWDVFNGIGERTPGTVDINAGYEALTAPAESAAARLSAAQFETPSPWNSVRHDFYTFRLAMDHLERHRPKVLYLALGETDDWAHDGRYDRVLETYARTDAYLAELWRWLETQPDYRGRTHLLVSTDLGRGQQVRDWKDHGDRVTGADITWMAFASPSMPRRGEWRQHAPIQNAQVAATLLGWLGLDPRRFASDAAAPVP
jgi:hypothetical protein